MKHRPSQLVGVERYCAWALGADLAVVSSLRREQTNIPPCALFFGGVKAPFPGCFVGVAIYQLICKRHVPF